MWGRYTTQRRGAFCQMRGKPQGHVFARCSFFKEFFAWVKPGVRGELVEIARGDELDPEPVAGAAQAGRDAVHGEAREEVGRGGVDGRPGRERGRGILQAALREEDRAEPAGGAREIARGPGKLAGVRGVHDEVGADEGDRLEGIEAIPGPGEEMAVRGDDILRHDEGGIHEECPGGVCCGTRRGRDAVGMEAVLELLPERGERLLEPRADGGPHVLLDDRAQGPADLRRGDRGEVRGRAGCGLRGAEGEGRWR